MSVRGRTHYKISLSYAQQRILSRCDDSAGLFPHIGLCFFLLVFTGKDRRTLHVTYTCARKRKNVEVSNVLRLVNPRRHSDKLTTTNDKGPLARRGGGRTERKKKTLIPI